MEAFIANCATQCQVSPSCHYHINHRHHQSISGQKICKKINTVFLEVFIVRRSVKFLRDAIIISIIATTSQYLTSKYKN